MIEKMKLKRLNALLRVVNPDTRIITTTLYL